MQAGSRSPQAQQRETVFEFGRYTIQQLLINANRSVIGEEIVFRNDSGDAGPPIYERGDFRLL